MKPEPLKDKGYCGSCGKNSNQSHPKTNDEFAKEDVKSAVEWLKEEIIFSYEHNLKCSKEALDEIKNTIDEAFEDVIKKS